MKYPLIIGAIAITASLALSACAVGDTHGNAADPSETNVTPGTNSHVIQMPNGFRNIAISCYGGNGIYVTSRGSYTDAFLPSSVAVIVHDPICG